MIQGILDSLASTLCYTPAITKKTLKELLLKTGGEIALQGRLYNINFKHLGVGVYKIHVTKIPRSLE